MSIKDKTRSTQFLRPNHAEFEIPGKPALVLCHMQRGLAGEGMFIPNWGPASMEGINDSGMVANCRALADSFRAKGLPVIFINAIPKPINATPAFGDLFREIDAAFPTEQFKNRHYFTDEWIRQGLEVMPEMGRIDSDYVLYNWQVHSFCCSGLELLCKQLGVTTLVWGGFAQNSVIYTSSLVASDFWLSNIIPVDASYISVPPSTPGYYEGLEDIVAEAIVRVLAPCVAQMTDTKTVLGKLDAVKEK